MAVFLRVALAMYVLNLWSTCRAEVPAAKLTHAVNSFSVNLLKELSGAEPRNLIVSPMSVSILLAILHQGARHNSSRQLESVLHLTQQESREGYGQLSRRMQEPHNTSAVLEVANHLFVGQGSELRSEFQDNAVQDFQSGVEQVSFGSGEGARAINAWVSQATHGRIPSIVQPPLSASTALVLANAIFFKSPWLNRFSNYSTSNQTFSCRAGREVTVPMMHHYGERFWAGIDEERGLRWVKLPFEDRQYSMVIVVPNEKYGLARLLSNLSADTLNELLDAGSSRDVTLHLPRFKQSSEINLEEALQQLGAKDIFDASVSDLSGIIRSSVPLVVSKALQKADIEVDEEGATAAAATVIQIVFASMPMPVNPMEITADHPFLAIILDETNRWPLFITTVVDPSSRE